MYRKMQCVYRICWRYRIQNAFSTGWKFSVQNAHSICVSVSQHRLSFRHSRKRWHNILCNKFSYILFICCRKLDLFCIYSIYVYANIIWLLFHPIPFNRSSRMTAYISMIIEYNLLIHWNAGVATAQHN